MATAMNCGANRSDSDTIRHQPAPPLRQRPPTTSTRLQPGDPEASAKNSSVVYNDFFRRAAPPGRKRVERESLHPGAAAPLRYALPPATDRMPLRGMETGPVVLLLLQWPGLGRTPRPGGATDPWPDASPPEAGAASGQDAMQDSSSRRGDSCGCE